MKYCFYFYKMLIIGYFEFNYFFKVYKKIGLFKMLKNKYFKKNQDMLKMYIQKSMFIDQEILIF